MASLNIMMIASEMVPYAKTGGLADVVGSLPRALTARGHRVRVVLPFYTEVQQKSPAIVRTYTTLGVRMGYRHEWCAVHETLTVDGISVYLVEHNEFFSRSGLYHDDSMNDFGDNPRRFAFLSRVALELGLILDEPVHIVHVHDWQTSLVPALLSTVYQVSRVFSGSAAVLTIHNMAYQGMYSKDFFTEFGLDNRYFHDLAFKSYDHINMLKGGIFFADFITTVSPTYANEILSSPGGNGLENYLARRSRTFVGVLNGADYSVWSPDVDQRIPARYGSDDMSGKRVCKADLQRRFFGIEDDLIAVIGIIGRFVGQKGFHLIAETIESIMQNMHVQFVILGKGDRGLEQHFQELQRRYPHRLGLYIGFSEDLAHLIEAGSDFFLMPSAFEPCGLNQLYSLRYGTLPIVRATGGLEDTIENYNETSGTGTGFKFYDNTVHALYYTVGWAISTYYDRHHHFESMQRRAMIQDYSWEQSARRYEQVYYRALEG